jgi:hypothetical protein
MHSRRLSWRSIGKGGSSRFASIISSAWARSSPAPNYADVVQYQKDVARRGEELADEAARLYAQYAEIGARKTQLQQRIYELTLSKP